MLDDPQVGSDLMDQERGIFQQSAIDTGHAHHDHQQHADADSRYHESAKVFANVFEGKVHGDRTFRPSESLTAGCDGLMMISPVESPSRT